MKGKIELITSVVADHDSSLTFSTPSGIYTYSLNRMAAEMLTEMAKHRPGKALNIAKNVADSVTKS